MTAPTNVTFTTGTTITSEWLNGVNDAINDSTQDITGAVARTVPAKLADMVSVKDFGAVGDSVADDTGAFTAALAASDVVYVPSGTYLIKSVELLSNKTIIGSGNNSVIKLLPTATTLRLFYAASASNISISNVYLDGNSIASYALNFTTCTYVKIENVILTACDGHGFIFDNCSRCTVDSCDFINTGKIGGYAAIYFANFTASGTNNRATNIIGDSVTGRLVQLVGQVGCNVDNVLHINVDRGEAVYFLDCQACSMNMITHIGGGAGSPSNPNPGNDGVAFGEGCFYCSGSNMLIASNSGHGVSINGGVGKTGALGTTLTNVRVVGPDEGGIVITDQGVAGSTPERNVISNCYVENPGVRVAEAAFSVSGGNNNQFINCYADDSRSPKRMTYGFQEISSANTASYNSFTGMVDTNSTLTAEFALSSNTSNYKNLWDEVARTKVTFNGTGAVGAQTIFRKTGNVSAVTKLGTGQYKVTFIAPMPASANITASARYYGGKNVVVVEVKPSATEATIQVYELDAGTANDSDYISIVVE